MNMASTTPAAARILLLDDERLILATLGSGLRQAGYEVLTAESVLEAEAVMAGNERPDLAILDVNLPHASGLDFALRLRELDQVPFIMLSAYSDKHYVDQASEAGALGYLVKPVDVVQLLPEVQAALARADELHGLRATRRQLQTALDNERDISVAVGILMVQHRMGRKAAFEVLRQAARHQRRRIADLAADAVQTFETDNLNPARGAS